MTLKYMQGFETMRDDSDFRAQGWIAAPSKLTMAFTPSVSGLSGTSMHLIGPGATSTSTSGASGVPDIGFLNTGITVNQAWTAGGFSFGFYGRFNSGVAASYGAGTIASASAIANNQICFDGTRYWAIKAVGSAYSIAYSTDLTNWTVNPNQPAAALDSLAGIFYMGSGVIAVIRSTSSTTSLVVYYSSNQGVSWSTQSMGSFSSGTLTGTAIATGNSTYPHAVFAGTSVTNAGSGGLFVGTLGGTMTQVATFTGSTNGWITNSLRSHLIGSLVVMVGGTNGGAVIYSATAANTSLNTTGAWSTATWSGSSPVATDIAYNATSNVWVVTTFSGISTFPNSGSAGTPVAPTGTVTLTSRYSTAAMTNIYNVGSTMYAVGVQGHIVSSTDGLVWTEVGAHILPVGTSGTNWQGAYYDGTRYVLTSDATSGVIATTPDFQTNFTAVYVMDGTEQSAFTNNNGHTGIYAGTAPASGTGLWTPAANFFAMAMGPLSSGVRAPRIVNASSGTETTFNIANAGTTFGHYYEMVAVASGTTNNFTHQVFIDGSLVYTSGSTAFLMGSGTSDTTSLLILTLERFATFVAFDDIYFNLIDGQGLSGQLGVINIVAQRPTTDTQAQWVKTGSASNNALSVNQAALSSLSSNYLTSNNAGDKDIYTTTDTVPAGYTPRAIQGEAYFTKTSTTAPIVNIGTISGSTEVDGASVTISGTGATYVSQIVEKDPNGNVAWTSSTVNAAKFVNTHSS